MDPWSTSGVTTTRTTADAGRYGTISVDIVPGIGRYNVYSTTSRHDETGEPVRLGWVLRSGSAWRAYSTPYADGHADDPFDTVSRWSENARTRREAIDALVWRVACYGRTFLVSDVR